MLNKTVLMRLMIKDKATDRKNKINSVEKVKLDIKVAIKAGIRVEGRE